VSQVSRSVTPTVVDQKIADAGGGGGGLTVVAKNDTNDGEAIADGEQVMADSSSAPFSLLLPPTPALGFRVRVTDANASGGFGTNKVTIGRNGSTIDSLSEDFDLDLDDGDAEFVYSGSTWRVTDHG